MTDYTRHRAAIALEALSVPIAATVQVLCPKCSGGDRGERKMSLTRSHNGAMYCCHRISCGCRGFVSMDGSGASRDIPRKPKPAQPYLGSAEYVGAMFARALVEKYPGFAYGTDSPHFADWALRYPSGGGWLFGCRGFNGELLGHVHRQPNKTIRTYRAREGVTMYSYYRSQREPIIVVEDCFSAMACASHDYDALALLGTVLHEPVLEILRSCSDVLIYLDADAKDKALKMQQAIGFHCKVVLDQRLDPKDNPNLGSVIKDYTT